MTDRVVINDHVGTVEAAVRTQAVAALIERRPCAAFAAFAVLHMAVWTALPRASSMLATSLGTLAGTGRAFSSGTRA